MQAAQQVVVHRVHRPQGWMHVAQIFVAFRILVPVCGELFGCTQNVAAGGGFIHTPRINAAPSSLTARQSQDRSEQWFVSPYHNLTRIVDPTNSDTPSGVQVLNVEQKRDKQSAKP